MSRNSRLNRDHRIMRCGRAEQRATFQEFESGIYFIENAIWLWIDRWNRIELRGLAGKAWLGDAIRHTSDLIDSRGTAAPAPWRRFTIAFRPWATSTRSPDLIRPTTLR